MSQGLRKDGGSWADGEMARPCSSHVYQVTLTPDSIETSSRRRPGVRR